MEGYFNLRVNIKHKYIVFSNFGSISPCLAQHWSNPITTIVRDHKVSSTYTTAALFSLYWHSGHKLQTHHWVMCLQPRLTNRKQTISAKCWLTALQLSRFWLVKISQSYLLIGWTYWVFKCERKVSCDTCAQLKDGFRRNRPTMSTKKTEKGNRNCRKKYRKLQWCKGNIIADSKLYITTWKFDTWCICDSVGNLELIICQPAWSMIDKFVTEIS